MKVFENYGFYLGFLVCVIVLCQTILSCSAFKFTETIDERMVGSPLGHKMGVGVYNSWDTREISDVQVIDQLKKSETYQAPAPLTGSELSILAKNEFKPECCPSPYSNSSGCVCITKEQNNYFQSRGGNVATKDYF